MIDKANYFVLFVLMFVSGLGVGINSGYIFWYLISDGMSAKGNNKIGIGVRAHLQNSLFKAFRLLFTILRRSTSKIVPI